jgi:hypothetical protein
MIIEQETHSAREAVAVFDTAATLQNAIDELLPQVFTVPS